MMTKKKTNQWTKMKVLVAIPAIAFSIAVFAKSEQTKDLETMFSHIHITKWTQNLITDNFASTEKTFEEGESLQRISTTIQDFNISGVWELIQSKNEGKVLDYTTKKNYKRYKILSKTGRYSTTEIIKTKHGTKVYPHESSSYEFTTDKRYIENGYDMKLQIIDDNTIIMTWAENEETWKRANNLSDDLVKYIETECNKQNELEDLLLKKNNLFD